MNTGALADDESLDIDPVIGITFERTFKGNEHTNATFNFDLDEGQSYNVLLNF